MEQIVHRSLHRFFRRLRRPLQRQKISLHRKVSLRRGNEIRSRSLCLRPSERPKHSDRVRSSRHVVGPRHEVAVQDVFRRAPRPRNASVDGDGRGGLLPGHGRLERAGSHAVGLELDAGQDRWKV